MAYERINNAVQVAQEFAKASPTEKKQIQSFTIKGSEPPPTGHCSVPSVGYWGLCRIRNLDTGKLFLTAYQSLDKNDLETDEFRNCIDLPELPKSKGKKNVKLRSSRRT